MYEISGFTFIHNGVEGGYPFVEAIEAVLPYVDDMVVVDAASTDETREVLEKLPVRILNTSWDLGQAGECLKRLHSMHKQCKHDIIWHFEADEVFDPGLASNLSSILSLGLYGGGTAVPRLQVEQNFQRCRWYPEHVHRLFWKGEEVKNGHTTESHKACTKAINEVSANYGFLWDVTNCFRDDWIVRCKNQAALWGHDTAYRYVPHHSSYGFIELHERESIEEFLQLEHWIWKKSPFNLPRSLACMVGKTSYRQHLVDRGFM